MTKSNEHQTHGKESDRFSSDLETLQHSFGQLREDVTTLLTKAVGTAKHGAWALRERAEGAVSDLKDRGDDSLEELAEKISERPFFYTAVAFGVGFLVAKLHSRR